MRGQDLLQYGEGEASRWKLPARNVKQPSTGYACLGDSNLRDNEILS